MSYTMTNWQDSPSQATPMTSANMLLYNAAINDIDSRIIQTEQVMTIAGTVVTANSTALANQFLLVNTTASSLTVTLPAAPADQSRVGVKHVVRGGLNTITIAASGTDVFNTSTGPTVITVSGVNQAVILQYVVSSGLWVTTSEVTPLSLTTTRAIAMSMVLGAFSP